MLLKNKNILITGAGKGIGLSSVIDCLNNGANVYALTRSKNDLKNLRSPLQHGGLLVLLSKI